MSKRDLDREKRFIKLYAERGKNAGQCAMEAGYGRGKNLRSATVMASRLLDRPDIQEGFRVEVNRLIGTDAALARNTLRRLLGEGSPAVQAQAAKILLDYAGYRPPTETHVSIEHKLSDAELRAKIGRLLTEISPEERASLARQGLLTAPAVIDAHFEPVAADTQPPDDGDEQ